MTIKPSFAGSSISWSGTSVGFLGEELYCFPSTIAQKALWYLDQLEPGNPSWNIAVRFLIEGKVDSERLRLALNCIAERHEVLRTTFTLVDDEPMQVVHSSATIPLPIDDLTNMPPLERDAEEERRTNLEATRGFHLALGPLFRTRLLRLAKERHILLVTVHHIVSDGWSIGIISDELAAHYQALSEGRSPAISNNSLQFADFAIWQNQHTPNVRHPHRAYWATKVASLPRCEIPTDHPRPLVTSHNGHILSTLLPVSLTETLARYSASQGCTLYMIALAALKVFIRQYTAQDDIYVGTLLAGRNRVQFESLIGVFVNTIVLRTDLSGDPTFPQLLERVRATVEEGLTHQDLPFQQLVEMLRPQRDRTRPTLYSINFIYQRDFVKPLDFSGLRFTAIPSKSPGAIYDLNFFMVRRMDGWRLSCEYNCDLYDASTVNAMIVQLRALLEAIAQNPDRKISLFPFNKLSASDSVNHASESQTGSKRAVMIL